MRDILKGEDHQIAAVIGILQEVRPDILVLAEFDVDYDNLALATFADELEIYPYRYAEMGNSGHMTTFDLDQNGRVGEPRDAQGYGRFAGDGGLAVLSRWPLGDVRSLSDVLWKDLPGATLPEGWPEKINDVQRLSSSAHLIVPVETDQGPLTLLAFAATPPVFDGPEDRNGLRAADEIRLWTSVIDGHFGAIPTAPVIIGKANVDPNDGDGRHDAMIDLLAHPAFQDPLPKSEGGRLAADPDQTGDPALDTADWPDDAPGNLRVSYILPPADWTVTGAGVFWPAPDDPLADLLGSDGLAAGPHRLVWVDIIR